MTTPGHTIPKLPHTGFGITFLVILTTLGISFWGLHQTVGTFEAVIHNEEVSEELLRLFVDLKEAEDQQREYLLTEEPRFLDPYQRAIQSTKARMTSLEKLAPFEGHRSGFFQDFKQLILDRLDLLQNILKLRDTKGTQIAIDSILTGEGMQLMRQIRTHILEFQQEDVRILSRLHKDAHDMERFTATTMILGMLLTLCMAMLTLWKIRKDFLARQEVERRFLEEAKIAEVSRLIGDVSHDIKNMLTPIQMGMTLLEDDLKEHFPQLCDTDQHNAKATQELSHDVIEMTRRGARRIQERLKEIADAVKGRSSPPKFVACRIEKIVDNVLDALRLYAEERGVSLQTQGLGTLPIVSADEQRLFNAFYNLVNNAIPEVPAGGSVMIKGTLSTNEKELLLSIEDTGRGMSPEVRNSLFTQTAVSRKPGGTGLGTKIVKDVIDVHGGTITVDSLEGQGTTFHIRLPKDGPSDSVA